MFDEHFCKTEAKRNYLDVVEAYSASTAFLSLASTNAMGKQQLRSRKTLKRLYGGFKSGLRLISRGSSLWLQRALLASFRSPGMSQTRR
jgi:hypothetical protein